MRLQNTARCYNYRICKGLAIENPKFKSKQEVDPISNLGPLILVFKQSAT